MKILRVALALAAFGTAAPASAGKYKKWLKEQELKRKSSDDGSKSKFHFDSWSDSSFFSVFKKESKPAPYTKHLSAEKQVLIDKVLEQAHRPTVEDVMKLVKATYGEIPAENPFGRAHHLSGKENALADMIAQMEHAYPGGTYLPLGRDVVALSDVMETFYRSIGQTNRVRRLDASGTSFPHYKGGKSRPANDETIAEDTPLLHGYLKANGLDLENIEKQHPFIMFDVTSFGTSSQSTQLLQAAYRTWAKMGKDPKALFDKVNFVGLPMGGGGKFIDRVYDIDEAKAKIKAEISPKGPRELLYVGADVGSVTYGKGGMWHHDFDDFQTVGGKIDTKPGRAHDTDERLEVLAEQFEIAKMIEAPAFLALVKKTAAEKYYYTFPTTRTEKLSRLAKPVRVEKVSYGSHGDRSVIQDAIEDQMKDSDSYARKRSALNFIEDMAGMWERSTFTDGQLRKAMHTIADRVDLEDGYVKYMLKDVFDKYAGFKAAYKKALE